MNYVHDKKYESLEFTISSIEITEFDNCQFRECDFTALDLASFKFLDCEFISCNLSNVKTMETAFQNVSMEDCKVIGLAFDTCKALNFSIAFHNCDLTHSIFYQVNLKKCAFKQCTLVNVDFAESDMEGIDIVDCDLSSAIFERSNLKKTDLRGSRNYNIDLDLNQVQKARFSSPEVLSLLDKYDIEID